MSVVHLGNKVGDGQLQLVDPQPPFLRARRQTVARAKEQQDVGSLADGLLAGHQERRRERRLARLFQHL